jgi:carbon-monoxide dehydrogenase medium subunit
MIPAAFDYARPGSVDEATELLSRHGEEAKLLAGGHSLPPMMKLRLAAPTVLVDLGRVSELRYIREAGDRLPSAP